MGSNINFKGFTNDLTSFSDAGAGGRPPGNITLTRQPSIYSLTFDELQTTIGGSLGKDFGSMNMDELLKSIWSAEETQTLASAGPSSAGGAPFQEGLQRQGSLTLPRTLSHKTVDEVWKDMSKEFPSGVVGSNGGPGGGINLTQRQQTLGEVTLEEFLVRAGVVREDESPQLGGGKVGANGGGYFGNTNNHAGLGIGFRDNRSFVGFSSNANSSVNTISHVSLQSATSPSSVDGFRLSNAQQQQQQVFPKQANVGYATQVAPLQASSVFRGGVAGIGDQGIGTGLIPGGGMGLGGLASVATGSPANQLSSDGIGKSNGDNSSVSPVPFVFNGGLRGRRAGGPVEKVAERRQRRMIKNRESAARSRARKQAYTMELETEVAKLKEENEELRKKHAEIMETQKNQVTEMMNKLQGGKRQRLRRTLTGPW